MAANANMKIVAPSTVIGIDEKEARIVFVENYLEKEGKPVLLKFQEIEVTFSINDFEHCVYEPDKEGNSKGKFSHRRATRILWIKEILEEKLPSKLLFEPETGNYCLFSEDLEYVVFIWPDKKRKTLRFRSAWAFGKKVERAMKKYKEGDKFIEVNKVEFE